MKSKIIQVSTCVMSDYDEPNGKWVVTTVLCEDGTLWRDDTTNNAWYQVDTDLLHLERA